MTHSGRFRAVVFAAVGGLGVTTMAGNAEAGLFDFLFGRSAPAPQYAYPNVQSSPLEVRVRPRRATIRREGGEKRVVATSIDPVKNPTWYLADPTLRRGDIVVLKGKILVYDGGSRGPTDTEDFTALKDSRLVSKGERERIQTMAGSRDSTTIETEILPGARKPTAFADPSGITPAVLERQVALRLKP